MVRAGGVALGGTMVAANAAMDRNRTWERLSEQEKTLMAEVAFLLRQAEATDKNEDDRSGDDSDVGLLRITTAKERLALIRRATVELEARPRNGPRSRRPSSRRVSVRSGRPGRNGGASPNSRMRRCRTRRRPT